MPCYVGDTKMLKNSGVFGNESFLKCERPILNKSKNVHKLH